MSLLESILSAQGGEVVKKMADSNGIQQNDALTVLSKLLPGITQNMQKNVSQSEGLDALFGALQKGNHQRYLEQPDALFTEEARQDGNNILGHLLGSKDASRSLAGQVASDTGISSTIIKKILPQVAALAMAALSKQSSSGGALSQLGGMLGGGQKSTAVSLLTSFLDRDNDGSIIDDVMAMAARQFLR